jgi:hypothetical protein
MSDAVLILRHSVGRDVEAWLSTEDAEGIDGSAIGTMFPRSKLSPRLWKGVSLSSLKSVTRLSCPTNPRKSRGSATGICGAHPASTEYEISV